MPACCFYNADVAATNRRAPFPPRPCPLPVNPRMGGGRTHKFHLEVWGVDLLINFFMTAVGIPINPPKVCDIHSRTSISLL